MIWNPLFRRQFDQIELSFYKRSINGWLDCLVRIRSVEEEIIAHTILTRKNDLFSFWEHLAQRSFDSWKLCTSILIGSTKSKRQSSLRANVSNSFDLHWLFFELNCSDKRHWSEEQLEMRSQFILRSPSIERDESLNERHLSFFQSMIRNRHFRRTRIEFDWSRIVLSVSDEFNRNREIK